MIRKILFSITLTHLLVYASPALPSGLDLMDESGPSLPPGLEIEEQTSPKDNIVNTKEKEINYSIEHNGFMEYRYGQRTRNKSNLHDDVYINEARLQFATDIDGEGFKIETAFDFLADFVAEDHSVDLESGDGWLDIRKLSLYWDINSNFDIKIGRQVITWGTGDLLFLNDQFPKDWRYFLGRDVEYMKAPSDAMRLTFYSNPVNIDVVYVPRFDSDRYLNGERLSIYDTSQGALVGKDNPISVNKPDRWFKDDEIHLRLFKNYLNTEFTLYAYEGFYKSPSGYNPAFDEYTFTRLRTMGFSLRRPLGMGIVNLEFSDWSSLDDKDGTNALIKNGETRYTVGYEFEAAKELTIGMQYYNERTKDYENYKASLAENSIQARKNRELLTLRVTKLLMSQNLKLGLFSYMQPANDDFYVHANVNYKVDDSWSTEVGTTLFYNEDEIYAQFGQLEENTHVYGMVRYSF